MKYLKVWTSFREYIQPLQYDEIGSLFEKMLIYAETGEEPDDFIGNERFLWAVAKNTIDITAEKNEILRQNGLNGGRPKTKQNQSEPNGTKRNQEVRLVPEKKPIKKSKEMKSKEMECKETTLSDDAAAGIMEEQNRVLDAAEDAGFQRTNSVRAKLIDLYSVHGMDKVLAAIDSCVQHGVANLAYLEAVLKGEPKKAPVRINSRQVPAQDYEQRDWSGDQEQAIEDMMKWDAEVDEA